MSLLEVNGLNSFYGDFHILFDVSFRVEQNEVVALLGRNGAGKSTTLKSLMGVVQPRAGTVKFDGVDVAGRKSHTIALTAFPKQPACFSAATIDSSEEFSAALAFFTIMNRRVVPQALFREK